MSPFRSPTFRQARTPQLEYQGPTAQAAPNETPAPSSVNPNDIRFSQNSVAYNKVDRVTGKAFTYDDIVSSMRESGWKGDHVDVVRMGDGGLTSIDNTRIRAAREAGIGVQAKIRNGQELLTPEESLRFTVRGKPRFTVRGKPSPTTWEAAITYRIGKQTGGFGKNNPFGSHDLPPPEGQVGDLS